MNRRAFVGHAGMLLSGLAVRLSAAPMSREAVWPEWRRFEIRTRVQVLKPAGETRIWLPEPLTTETPFQKTLMSSVRCDGGVVKKIRDRVQGLGIAYAQFPAGTEPVMTVVSRVATRDWTADLDGTKGTAKLSASERDALLRPTKYVPTDGIVRQRALEITKHASTEREKGRAIYDWVVENTYRDPKIRGCGRGDIRSMLESGNLGGKCADLNALYVGLARAVGLPARDVYGIRVAPSKSDCKSLGTSSPTITKAQHCRAEVYLNDSGWVPVDAADVRKVMLEESPGHRALDDELVKSARARLFGTWEMNWIAYNFAQDVVLPESKGGPIHYFMYPEAETDEGRLDSLDPDTFRYEITGREIAG